MKYRQPFGISDESAGYIDGNPALGIEGSAVPMEALEHPQREIVNVILEAGLTPDRANLKQLALAIQALIAKAMPKTPEKYDIGQYYWFEDEIARPGLKPCLGGLIQNASQVCPEMVAYLKSPGGQFRCVTQSEWDALHVATWHTCADGTKIGWQGIGGVNKFVLDVAADTLRLPDLAGMMPEMIGCDSLGVGGTHGDAARQLTGALVDIYGGFTSSSSRAFAQTDARNAGIQGGVMTYGSHDIAFDSARVVPVANKFQPRAWGALACVYLGQPAS